MRTIDNRGINLGGGAQTENLKRTTHAAAGLIGFLYTYNVCVYILYEIEFHRMLMRRLVDEPRPPEDCDKPVRCPLTCLCSILVVLYNTSIQIEHLIKCSQ